VRVTREVLVQTTANDGELVALSSVPASIDERLVLDIAGGSGFASVLVTVVGSRPVMIDGTMRHELRLRQVGNP
jgi:hypothetical protein